MQALCVVGLVAALLGSFIGRPPRATPNGKAGGRTIIDMAGRMVTVPDQIRRAACLEVLCYEKFFLLGSSGKVTEMLRTDPPWMSTIDPDVNNVRKVENEIPDREELLKDDIDIVFHRYNRLQLRGLAAVGIPAVVSQPPLQTHFKDAHAFADAQKHMVRLLAQIIGTDAERRAEMWCAYCDEHMAYVLGRTANIPEEQRPRAYYLRGPNATTTQGPQSNTYWYGVMGGANMIVKNLALHGQGLMSMEEIVKLDPDFIFVGRQYAPELVLNDPKWQSISAIRNHHVISLPGGMFYWDGSTEGILLAEFIAKTLYPDRFADLDMASEVRRYFKEFYNFDFTDIGISRFLRGLTPAGVRRNH
jgi:iron complex transport system substrate-binding protein